MRVIIKPGGLAALVLALGVLAAFAAQGVRHAGPAAVAVPTPDPSPERSGAAPAAASVRILEAERTPRGEVREDASASGGKYVRVTKDYEPMLFAPVPAGGAEGDAFTVWARIRGVPVQLKGTPGGRQAEYDWNWDAPKTFRWVRLGRHTRAELGPEFLILRGAGRPTTDGEGIDAVAVSPDDSFDPAAADANVSPR
jgi:hypothetical protein